MTVDIIGNSGMKTYDGNIRFVFDGVLFPVDISVEELRAKLITSNPLGLQDKVDLKIEFNKFWEKYGLKVGKAKAMKSWMRLSAKDRAAVLENVELWVQAHPDTKFRCHPATYLNGRRWEDELPEHIKPVVKSGWAKPNTWE